jgi:hypothetical protein
MRTAAQPGFEQKLLILQQAVQIDCRHHQAPYKDQGCKGPEWEELSCEPAERLWSDGVCHRTLHVVRQAEVSGILIAVGGATLQGVHGRGTLRVFAPDDAAEGDYLIPLEGAYLPDPELCAEAAQDAGVSDAGGAASSPCVAPAVANALLPLLRSRISAVRIQVR